MCEYIHNDNKPWKPANIQCYDRHWDGKEFFEDDTYQDSAFTHNEYHEEIDGKLYLRFDLIKRFETFLGSLDDYIRDGENLQVTWLHGDMDEGIPEFKIKKYKKGTTYLQLDKIADELAKYADDL